MQALEINLTTVKFTLLMKNFAKIIYHILNRYLTAFHSSINTLVQICLPNLFLEGRYNFIVCAANTKGHISTTILITFNNRSSLQTLVVIVCFWYLLLLVEGHWKGCICHFGSYKSPSNQFYTLLKWWHLMSGTILSK